MSKISIIKAVRFCFAPVAEAITRNGEKRPRSYIREMWCRSGLR